MRKACDLAPQNFIYASKLEKYAKLLSQEVSSWISSVPQENESPKNHI